MSRHQTPICIGLIGGLVLVLAGCVGGPEEHRGYPGAGDLSVASTSRPHQLEPGIERIFTNASVVAWVPTRATQIWDEEATAGVQIDEITRPGDFIKEYKISILIEVKTTRAFQFYAERFSEWDFQEHPDLVWRDGEVGRQFRKDIRDPARDRVIRISALVRKGATFARDEALAKRIVTSIRVNLFNAETPRTQ
jgi:hypothetical protein